MLVFSSKNKPHSSMNIDINGEITYETSMTMFLGIMIYDELSWRDHIWYLSRKLARGTGEILKVENISWNKHSSACIFPLYIRIWLIETLYKGCL